MPCPNKKTLAIPLPQVTPTLRGLGLGDDELRGLRQQGFVRTERRPGKTVYRLCYRHEGRQRARHLRARDVAAVEAELAALQNSRRARQQLTTLAKHARRMLGQRKQLLAPLLEASGRYFHGNEVRRRRANKQ